jgi:hypothetical protein
LGRSQKRDLRRTVAIVGARVEGKLGRIVEAEKLLEGVIGETLRAGSIEQELEARLALGEVELASADSAAGRARLEVLEREATERGLGLIARRAGTALARHPTEHG